MTTARSARHQRLSAILASCGDAELAALMDTDRAGSAGVGGGSAVVDVDGVPVFVKRIPLTDRELAHPGSTANLFDLPVFCQYGIGSLGFNAWRELAANRVVTNAVLAGETQSFPVLYHWRVLPGRSPVASEHADIDAVVAALGGSSAVRVRLEALVAASCSLVLFCEYIAHPVSGWLREDPVGKAATVERHHESSRPASRPSDPECCWGSPGRLADIVGRKGAAEFRARRRPTRVSRRAFRPA